MPFIGAPSPKDYDILETISDRKTYTGDGIKKIFGVSYHDNHISVFQNGLKLAEGIDYNIASSGQYITFIIPPESGDLIDLIGAVGVTNLSQSSYLRETFVATAGQNNVVLTTSTVDASVRMNVYVNGIRLTETDYTINYTTKTITFINNLAVDDTIAVDLFQPGFRIQSLQLTDLGISDGASNQVLTTDGNGVFYFANTAAGGVSLASFTANGTITAGETVSLRADNGEIEKTAYPTLAQYTEVSQSLDEATQTGTTFFDVGYDENTSSVIVAQRSEVSPFNGFVSIGTVTETSNTTTNGETTREVGFSWGTPVAWNSDSISRPMIAIDTDQNKVVITYINNSDAINIYAVVGDISGNSITFGTPLELYTTRSEFNSIVYDTNSNKIVLYFQDYSSKIMYYAVCTVSGTTITLDSPLTSIVTAASSAYSTAFYIPELNKHVLLYLDTSDYPTIMIGELSSGTITWGSAVTVQSAIGITPFCRYDSVNEKLLLYIGQNNADSNYQSMFIGTITNNSATFGSAIRVSTANPYASAANIFVHHKASNKFIIGGTDGNNSVYPYYSVVQIDDSAPNGLSISSVTDIVYTGSSYFGIGGGVYASNFEKIFVGIRPNNTDRPNIWTYNPEYTIYGLTTNANNYIGIVKDSVSSGQVSEVFLVGDIADNQTGLTTNQTYYLNEDGTLSTTQTSYGLVGRAISSTSIQLLQTVPESLTNLNITDGTSGQVLKTYGNNTFYFADEENLNAILYSIALG